MTPGPALTFPSGRALAGWWRQLEPLHAQALAVGHLLLHRVDALARARRPTSLDRVDALVLRLLAVEPPRSLRALDKYLGLGAAVVAQLLRGLEREGLARESSPDEWAPTELGHQAARSGVYPRGVYERRTFAFIEHGRPGRPPHFLHLLRPVAVPWAPPEGWEFDVAALRAAAAAPAEWKDKHHFPLDVEEIVGPWHQPPADAPSAWERVVLDRPERLLAALVQVPREAGGTALVGFPVRQDGWLLNCAEPAFRIDASWESPFPDLAEDPGPEAWRAAWQAWCQPRGIPAGEVAACRLERQDHRLRVTAARKLIERLRAARSDVFKGEAWLLAGSSRIQTAARLELIEGKEP